MNKGLIWSTTNLYAYHEKILIKSDAQIDKMLDSLIFYFDDAPMQILANVKSIDFDMKRFLVRLDHNLLQFFTYLLV